MLKVMGGGWAMFIGAYKVGLAPYIMAGWYTRLVPPTENRKKPVQLGLQPPTSS